MNIISQIDDGGLSYILRYGVCAVHGILYVLERESELYVILSHEYVEESTTRPPIKIHMLFRAFPGDAAYSQISTNMIAFRHI